MKIKSFTEWRAAAAAVRDTPAMRALNRKKAGIDKKFASGKLTRRQYAVLKKCLRVLRDILVLKEMTEGTRALKQLQALRRKRLNNRTRYALLKGGVA